VTPLTPQIAPDGEDKEPNAPRRNYFRRVSGRNCRDRFADLGGIGKDLIDGKSNSVLHLTVTASQAFVVQPRSSGPGR
jgi:hypothetical protein